MARGKKRKFEEKEADGDGQSKDGAEDKPKRKQRTLENTREFDETIVDVDDDEVMKDTHADSFGPYFKGDIKPKVGIVTGRNPGRATFSFVKDLLLVIPDSEYIIRDKESISKIVEVCSGRSFTDVIFVIEEHKRLYQLILVHLPEGPSAVFRLSSHVTSKRIAGHAANTGAIPEVIINRFTTRLGISIARMLSSLFRQNPEFEQRTVATFHNQRDFILFRHHRYVFEKTSRKIGARLQEIGPRFTLKLEKLQKGIFDYEKGEYIWLHKKEMDTSRKRFFL